MSQQDRGQSELMGTILIMGLTLIGITGILVFGASALTESHSSAEIGRAEHAMTQLDSRLSLVALGSSENQLSSFSFGSTENPVVVNEDSGWMNVSVTSGGSTTVLMNETLGELTYRNGGTTIAYQGGGVWKQTPAGTTMISPPEFHYRPSTGSEPTLTLPLVVVNGSGSVYGDLELDSKGMESKYPVTGNASLSNPLSGGTVNVTVGSDYYRAWGRYFESRTGGKVSYDHPNGTVMISLVVPRSQPSTNWALGGTGAGTLHIWEYYGDHPKVDAYNSSDGVYPGFENASTTNATVVINGDLVIGDVMDIGYAAPKLYADFIVGGSFEINTDNPPLAEIHGNVSYGGTKSCDPSGCPQVKGTIDDDADVPPVTSIGSLVQDKIDTISQDANNNNSDNATDAIKANGQWASGSPLGLEAGTYYVSKDTLKDQKVTLDTSDGNITIAIDDNVDWRDVEFEVTGPEENFVRIYHGGDKFILRDSTKVGNLTSDDATDLRIYGGGGKTIRIIERSTFVGLYYAPGSGVGGSHVRIGETDHGAGDDDYGEVYGSIVTGSSGEIQLARNASLHYDEALRDIDLVFTGSSAPKVTYLHVTVNEVEVHDR